MKLTVTEVSQQIPAFQIVLTIEDDDDAYIRLKVLREVLVRANLYAGDGYALLGQIDEILTQLEGKGIDGTPLAKRRELAVAQLQSLNRERQTQVFELIETLTRS